MPPRNHPLPNAVNIFNCDICSKGYSRQTDYENHLRSYDHNHRQRLADMKKLTAANALDASRPARSTMLDMASMPLDDGNKKGPRFKKIGIAAAGTALGGRFKKVGVVVGESKEDDKTKKNAAATEASSIKVDIEAPEKDLPVPVADAEVEPQADMKKDEDVIMADGDDGDDGDETITWEEYDFTKPTDCDHANCPGCDVAMGSVNDHGWLTLGAA